MANPRQTHTNAADSAPGVDDGRANARAPGVDSKPGGRKAVMWIVIAALVILAVSLIWRPDGSSDRQVEPGTMSPAATEPADVNPAAP